MKKNRIWIIEASLNGGINWYPCNMPRICFSRDDARCLKKSIGSKQVSLLFDGRNPSMTPVFRIRKYVSA